WRHSRSPKPRGRDAQIAAPLRSAGRTQYAAAHDLSLSRVQSQPGAGGIMSDTAQRCELVTERLSGLVLRQPLRRDWLVGFALAFALLMLLNVAIAWLLIK